MLSMLLLSAAGFAALPSGYHPVIMSGPFMGQNLEVKNDNTFTVCNTGGDYKHLWMNLEGTTEIDYVQDFYCISKGLTIEWDNENKISKPRDNIHVRPFGYAGSTKDQLEGLTTFAGGNTEEYALVVRMRSIGYEIGESLFGHTFDWRLSMRDWEQQYFPAFKKIIEDAAHKNNGSPVVLTGISMSGQYNHGFISWIKRVFGSDWLSTYIHALVPVATGWNGAVMASSTVLDSVLGTWRTDGECPNCKPSQGIPMLAAKETERRRMDGLTDWMKTLAAEVGDGLLQDLFASFPATYTVHPGIDFSTNPPTDPEVVTIRNANAPAACTTVCGAKQDDAGYKFETGFLAKDQCGECFWSYGQCPDGFDRAHDGWTQDLCCKRHQCEARTYKASELPELYRSLGKETYAQLMEYSLTLDTTSDPGVPVHCVYSHNVQTFNLLKMSANHETEQKTLDGTVFLMDDGDQTVDHNSLEVCSRWSSTVKTYKVNGVAHSAMLGVEQVLDVIQSVATEDQATLDAWKPVEYTDVRPQALTVAPSVLMNRSVCFICERPEQLNPDAQYMDPSTQQLTKCSDADGFCARNDCGDITELRNFFKHSTNCCTKETAKTFNPLLWRLNPPTPPPTPMSNVGLTPTPPPTPLVNVRMVKAIK